MILFNKIIWNILEFYAWLCESVWGGKGGAAAEEESEEGEEEEDAGGEDVGRAQEEGCSSQEGRISIERSMSHTLSYFYMHFVYLCGSNNILWSEV